MHLRPLHALLGFPERVGLQAVAPQIADAVGAIGFGSDREPRRSRDGVAHGRVMQRLNGLLPHAPLATRVKRLVARGATHWPEGLG